MDATFSAAQVATLLVSSSVLAAVVSIAGNHLLAQLQFKRDYFREIIAKRLRAYENVDELITILRGTTYDDTGRIAHVVFLNKALYDRATSLAATAGGFGLYVSQPIRDALMELNFTLLRVPEIASEAELFDIAASHRESVSALRQRLESIVTTDLLSLYKVRRFLKQMRRQTAKPAPPFVASLPKHGAFSFRESEKVQ